MRLKFLAAAATTLGILACETSEPLDVAPTFHLAATVTAINTCNVSVRDQNYSSVNMVRGDVPKAFVGTVADGGYHGFGCWVAVNGVSPADGDGDLIVLFAGNTLGKPLTPGTYQLKREILDDTPLGFASVVFRPSDLNGDKLVSLDGAVGSVVVEATPDGGRLVKVDAEVSRWGRAFY
jgi:hypothetical protein